ncbi:MAG: hypothetical protein AAF989_07740 [Planctomycetota bacterium]
MSDERFSGEHNCVDSLFITSLSFLNRLNMLRHVFATILGAVSGAFAVGLVEWGSSLLHPMPDGIDLHDQEGLSEWVRTLPWTAFAMLLVAWGLGCFVGGWVARRLAPGRGRTPAWIVVSLLTIATASNLVMLPHPNWMWPAGMLVCIFFGWCGIVVSARGS